MATKKPYLIGKLVLDNFMIHRHTEINMGERPITLITGANGSGKTQILDALILALGHHPKRLKKGKLDYLIGPFAAETRIELSLYNPRNQQKRLIQVPHQKLLELTDLRSFPGSGIDPPGNRSRLLSDHFRKKTQTIAQRSPLSL